MSFYAVIDTNVFVSALITKNTNSATIKILDYIFEGKIIPLYHTDIINEYFDVLHRKKFNLTETKINYILKAIKFYGVEVYPKPTGEILIDMDDLIFYEVVMEKQDAGAFLVTGNKKHFPIKPFIVTPAEMAEIIEKQDKERK